MPKIKLTTDSTCDLTPDLIKALDIDVIRLIVSLGDKTFRDGEDITPADIFSYVERYKTLPKTAAPAPEDFEKLFAAYADGYDAILHVGISGGLSASCQNARIAAQGFKNVTVVDGLALSTGTALLLIKAAGMIKEGLEVSVIAERLNALRPKVQTSFVVDSLEYLHKGGRCSGLARLGATILRLHPVLYLQDGLITVHKKLRGKLARVHEDYLDNLLADFPAYDTACAFITHSGLDGGQLAAVQELVRQKFNFQNIHVTSAGSTITSHCGPNTVGLLFIRA